MMHISVVEDNPLVLEMIETTLVLQGHIVEAFNDAPSFLSALQRARHTPPYDLIIVDLFLERYLGTDIIDALRDAHPQIIPTILMSAAEASTLAPFRKRYPNLPILQKPFKMQVLVSLINEVTSSVKI